MDPVSGLEGHAARADGQMLFAAVPSGLAGRAVASGDTPALQRRSGAQGGWCKGDDGRCDSWWNCVTMTERKKTKTSECCRTAWGIFESSSRSYLKDFDCVESLPESLGQLSQLEELMLSCNDKILQPGVLGVAGEPAAPEAASVFGPYGTARNARTHDAAAIARCRVSA